MTTRMTPGMPARHPSGHSLIELMVVVTIMAIMAVGMAQFSATAFQKQARATRQTQGLSTDRATLTILDRDFALTGFGQPLGTRAITVLSAANAQNDVVQLIGGPLAGPRRTQWAYVLQSSMAGSTSLVVNCVGQLAGGNLVPNPITDITVTSGSPLAVQIFNYTGSPITGIPADIQVVASSATCAPGGTDSDGDGIADLAQTLTLGSSLPIPAIPSGALVVPVNSYQGVGTPLVTYSVNASRQLVRQMANGVSEPVVENVESFQVQYGWSQTDGTFAAANWSATPPWQANLRLRAVRVHLVTADPKIRAFAPASLVQALDYSYTVTPDAAYYERRHIERLIRTPNAVFAHP